MKNNWELQIFHELPSTVEQLGCLAVGDVDGDGQIEVVTGGEGALLWYRYTLDDRFEHHDGTKVFEISPGKLGIISHGWKDSIYVHLWEAY